MVEILAAASDQVISACALARLVTDWDSPYQGPGRAGFPAIVRLVAMVTVAGRTTAASRWVGLLLLLLLLLRPPAKCLTPMTHRQAQKSQQLQKRSQK